MANRTLAKRLLPPACLLHHKPDDTDSCGRAVFLNHGFIGDTSVCLSFWVYRQIQQPRRSKSYSVRSSVFSARRPQWQGSRRPRARENTRLEEEDRRFSDSSSINLIQYFVALIWLLECALFRYLAVDLFILRDPFFNINQMYALPKVTGERLGCRWI